MRWCTRDNLRTSESCMSRYVDAVPRTWAQRKGMFFFVWTAEPVNLGHKLATFSHTKKKLREVAWAPSTAALSFALEDTATHPGFSGQRHGATRMTRVDARTCPHAGGALFPSIKGGWTYKTTTRCRSSDFFFFFYCHCHF